MNLSALEEWVVDALLRRVRVLAVWHLEMVCQIRGYGQSPKQVIRTLKRKGLVESFICNEIVLELQSPLAVWQAGDESSANFSKIAWRARARFLNAKIQEHQILIATELAERLLGGVGGSLRQPNQVMHDLGTSSVYVTREAEKNQSPNAWTGEDVIRRSWRHLGMRKIPDAAFIENENIVNVIEFAGRDYGKAYLEKFHRYWQRQATSYEIW
ncbi:hypothetical protein N9L06_00330 [Mariniblastus sp.]|nr:hypothetical protein [Mariniblastus sp.]